MWISLQKQRYHIMCVSAYVNWSLSSIFNELLWFPTRVNKYRNILMQYKKLSCLWILIFSLCLATIMPPLVQIYANWYLSAFLCIKLKNTSIIFVLSTSARASSSQVVVCHMQIYIFCLMDIENILILFIYFFYLICLISNNNAKHIIITCIVVCLFVW